MILKSKPSMSRHTQRDNPPYSVSLYSYPTTSFHTISSTVSLGDPSVWTYFGGGGGRQPQSFNRHLFFLLLKNPSLPPPSVPRPARDQNLLFINLFFFIFFYFSFFIFYLST